MIHDVSQQTRSGARRRASKLSYEWYINSPAWERRKIVYYARHKKACRACGTTENIHLHHHTYKRLGTEHDDDLIPLCQSHHEAVHEVHRASEGTMTLTQATRQVIGGPLHPSRKRKKPKAALRRQRPEKRKKAKKKDPPAPKPPDIEMVGLRVIVTTDARALSWANGRHGTIRDVISPISWHVELDDMPGSRLAVTVSMIRREK